MTKVFSILFCFLAFYSYGQSSKLEIVTKNNDTLREYKLRREFSIENKLVLDVEEKLTVRDSKGDLKEFLPKDVKFFTFYRDGKLVRFDNIEDKVFGLLMYSNKLKLYKTIIPSYTPVNVYIIARPNNTRISYMEATGFSRLISNNVVLREISDCQITSNKIKNDELKIKGEKGVIQLIIDYELNCY
ncbi:hypothetical protein [Flavobacterium helocola]|jgi:hypothetical protein|uniref:Uncharacterized protein n=1 Tax=Flavobacterium helocola TaxID=3139139 RepID=A0ABU9I435_9FLAO